MRNERNAERTHSGDVGIQAAGQCEAMRQQSRRTSTLVLVLRRESRLLNAAYAKAAWTILNLLRRCIVLIACSTLIAFADGSTFDKVRYSGGTTAAKAAPDDWGNKLTVTSGLITFALKDGQKINIQPKSVNALSYGREDFGTVGPIFALFVLLAPWSLPSLSRRIIKIEYMAANGKPSTLALQGDNSNDRAILVALHQVTGVPVAVSEEDRSFIPMGVRTDMSMRSGSIPTEPDETAIPAAKKSIAAVKKNMASVPELWRLMQLVRVWAVCHPHGG